ncbi:MAG: M48 family metallopeptidase [Verrucomicrobiota bacterium]
MDFFERQDDARKKSKILIVYFVLAVIGIIAAIYLLLAFGLSMTGDIQRSGYNEFEISAPASKSLWNPELLFGTSIGVLAVVLLGSGFKTMSLGAGGSVIARELGGRKLDSNTTDADERKLMNVVEEMAIASGVPVPEVYLMENEHGINAFAAGLSPSDAVVGVTRGCMKLLNRDELQGVIAHEFSHILNGDMKLNLRLIGLLFGILMLSLLGRIIMRTAYYSGSGRSNSGKNNGLPLLLFGLALMIIGYIGVLFGHLIKSAISRQREFLADASAVQFTRNPDGIGGALKKIGGLSYGSKIVDPHAEEASHMFFANGMAKSFSQAFATHPPLRQRIKAIEPHWDGKFPKVSLPEISSSMDGRHSRGRGAVAGLSGLAPSAGGTSTGNPSARDQADIEDFFSSMAVAKSIDSIGQISEDQIRAAQSIHREFPENWLHAVHNESGAQALIFAMLLAQDDALRGEELKMLGSSTDRVTYDTTVQLHQEFGDLHSSRKIALIDLAVPTLRKLSPGEYDRFVQIMRHLIASDQKVDLFEFMLQKIIQRHLDIHFKRHPRIRIRYNSISQLADDAEILLSTLAFLGTKKEEKARKAFDAGASEIESAIGGKLDVRSGDECGLQRIDEALNRFELAAPLVKKRLLLACGKTVMADEKIVSDEAELLRTIADTIGCPIPPFVKE